MEVKLDLVGIVTRDTRAPPEFYGRRGLDVPAGAWPSPGPRLSHTNQVDLFAAL